MQSQFPGGLIDAERLEVVAGHDRGRWVRHLQERPATIHPFVDIELAMAEQLGHDRDPGRVHRGAETVDARPAAQDPGRTADDRDPFVAERSRWRVAVSPPFQFVAPIDGVSCRGSPVGSTMTSGMPRAASCVRTDPLSSAKTAMTPAGRRASAERSLVLVQNEGILPLRDDTARIAVIGPADSARDLLGDYSHMGHRTRSPRPWLVTSTRAEAAGDDPA